MSTRTESDLYHVEVVVSAPSPEPVLVVEALRPVRLDLGAHYVIGGAWRGSHLGRGPILDEEDSWRFGLGQQLHRDPALSSIELARRLRFVHPADVIALDSRLARRFLRSPAAEDAEWFLLDGGELYSFSPDEATELDAAGLVLATLAVEDYSSDG